MANTPINMPRFSQVPPAQWQDWRWQQQNRVTTLGGLQNHLHLSPEERQAFAACAARFRVAITPYYLSLMDPDDPACPIRQQAVPQAGELRHWPGERPDPLAEEAHSPVPGLVHRYPDRVLLYTTHHCAMYCRFCTRKRKVSNPGSATSRPALGAALDYIRHTPTVRDVIISGGDPLSLSNERLSEIFAALAAIPHVEVARLGTRNLVTLPMRVDSGLLAVLRRHQTRHLAIFLMTHFNHPKECTDTAFDACADIASSGTPIQNQMVLLRGVNDSAATVATLNRQLLRMRVKPYYILHADLAEGIGHFRTEVETGRRIMDELRGWISGLAVPQYVVDLPNGGGKVPVIPRYELPNSRPGNEQFRNYRGQPHHLGEPS